MGVRDKRVDAYIDRSAPFAKPILKHLRKLVHKAVPAASETIKWGIPSFDYKGMMCSMAAFKEHCAFGFWKASLMQDKSVFSQMGKAGMGHMGKITSISDLRPDAELLRMIREAARLNEQGITAARRRKRSTITVRVPADLSRAISKNKKVKVTFESFSPSNKRDYVEWITEAKTPETRAKRLRTALEWMAEGKPRNWKYMRVKG